MFKIPKENPGSVWVIFQIQCSFSINCSSNQVLTRSILQCLILGWQKLPESYNLNFNCWHFEMVRSEGRTLNSPQSNDWDLFHKTANLIKSKSIGRAWTRFSFLRFRWLVFVKIAFLPKFSAQILRSRQVRPDKRSLCCRVCMFRLLLN